MADLAFLAAAAGGAAEHAEPAAWHLNADGWWAMTVIAVILLMLFYKVPAVIAEALDKRIASVRQALDEAAQLRSEAEALKAEYERKVADAGRHAEELRVGAEKEAAAIVEKAKADATALIARHEKMAEDKIAAAERAAVADLRARAVEAAAAAARTLIAEQHGAEADAKLVDKAISDL